MSFSHLPDELVYMICEKLESVVDLVKLSFCSKRLNLLCKNSKYKNNVYDIENEENMHKIPLALEFNKNIQIKLDLIKNNISDVSKLENVHTLNLSSCRYVTDVSKLDRVHTLNLALCKNITDFSTLYRVKSLNLA
jgi:hypothetical protein